MARRGRQLVSSHEAQQANGQHTKPCGDCPWARTALNGWLGSMTADEWVRTAHSDAQVDCHTLLGAQCAGLAIYRRNVAKFAHPPLLRLEADRELVFSNPVEFKEHHSKPPEMPMSKKKRTDKKHEPKRREDGEDSFQNLARGILKGASLKSKLEDIDSSSHEEAFSRAAQVVSEYLCTIPCSPEDYRSGLRDVIEQLQIDLRASEECG